PQSAPESRNRHDAIGPSPCGYGRGDPDAGQSHGEASGAGKADDVRRPASRALRLVATPSLNSSRVATACKNCLGIRQESWSRPFSAPASGLKSRGCKPGRVSLTTGDPATYTSVNLHLQGLSIIVSALS